MKGPGEHTRRAEEPTLIRGVFQAKHAARVPPELCLKSVRANIPNLGNQ